MDDLISRAHVLAEYDRQHKGRPGGARKIMEDAPAVDAIPVEWLKKKREVAIWQFAGAIDWLLGDWQKEQEAQDG